jgi:Na+/melibiose symporter-like transporter
MKAGKYLPWIRISSFLIPLATIFMFAIPSGASIQVKIIWSAFAYILWDTSYTICDVPIFALATSMTNNVRERDNLFILNRFFGLLGGLITLILVPALYPNIGWTATIIVLALVGMATMLPIGLKGKERYAVPQEKSPTIKELFHYLITNKPLLLFSAAIIVMSITNTASTMQAYTAIYCLGGPEWITIMALVSTLPILIVVAFSQKLIAKVEKKSILIFSISANLGLGIVLYFVGYVLFLLICLIRSTFSSILSVIMVMFVADCAEFGNYATGNRAQGVAFSVQTFTAKITAAISSTVGMFLLGMIGFQSGEDVVQAPSTIAWIWRFFTIAPIVSGSVAVLILLFGYKLKSSDVTIMMKCNQGEITKEEAEVLLEK